MILNETQQAIADAVRDFAQEQLRPRTQEFEAAGGYPPALFEELAGLGLMGMTAPEEFGGAGADTVSYALSLMEIGAADGASLGEADGASLGVAEGASLGAAEAHVELAPVLDGLLDLKQYPDTLDDFGIVPLIHDQHRVLRLLDDLLELRELRAPEDVVHRLA